VFFVFKSLSKVNFKGITFSDPRGGILSKEKLKLSFQLFFAEKEGSEPLF
jgi:hypothetical protein